MIDLLKKIWICIYDPHQDTKEMIEQYFHPDYEQCINGVVMRREEYIQHVLEQKRNIFLSHINYERFMEQEDELFVIYTPVAKNLKGENVEAEVIAYFKFEGEQIIQIHGHVRLIAGDLSDVDM